MNGGRLRFIAIEVSPAVNSFRSASPQDERSYFRRKTAQFTCYSISKSIVSLSPSTCHATALSAAHRLVTIDLEMELGRNSTHFRIDTLKPTRKFATQLHQLI